MFSAEEKTEGLVPIKTQNGFIAILCNIFDDGSGDRFFLLRLYMGFRARVEHDQNLIIVCMSAGDYDFFKEKLPHENTPIYFFRDFLTEFRNGSLGTCYGVIEGPAFGKTALSTFKEFDQELRGSIPWVLLPEYNLLEDSIDRRPDVFNSAYFRGEQSRNRVLFGTGFGRWNETENRLGVFIPTIDDAEQTLTIDPKLLALFTAARLDFTHNPPPHFTVAYLNNFECMKELSLEENLQQIIRMLPRNASAPYLSTDLFLGNWVHSLCGQVPNDVYLTLISPYPTMSKKAIARSIQALSAKFSEIVLYEEDNTTSDIMSRDSTNGNHSTLRIILIRSVAHSTWLSLLRLSSGNIVGATGDQSFIEALKASNAFVAYEQRHHKKEFYKNFTDQLLLIISEQYQRIGAPLTHEKTRLIRKFFIKLGDGYLPIDTDFSTDSLFNDPEFRRIYIAAKEVLLDRYDLDDNLIEALPSLFPQLKLSATIHTTNLLGLVQEKLSSCAVLSHQAKFNTIEIQSMRGLIHLIIQSLKVHGCSVIMGQAGQLDTLVLPLKNNRKFFLQVSAVFENRTIATFIERATQDITRESAPFEVKKDRYIQQYSNLVNHDPGKIASFIDSLNIIRGGLVNDIFFKRQTSASSPYNSMFSENITSKNQPLEKALALLDDTALQIIHDEESWQSRRAQELAQALDKQEEMHRLCSSIVISTEFLSEGSTLPLDVAMLLIAPSTDKQPREAYDSNGQERDDIVDRPDLPEESKDELPPAKEPRK